MKDNIRAFHPYELKDYLEKSSLLTQYKLNKEDITIELVEEFMYKYSSWSTEQGIKLILKSIMKYKWNLLMESWEGKTNITYPFEYSEKNIKQLGNLCGIYGIKHKKYNKIYIGKSLNIRERLLEELRLLEKNKHHNKVLQYDFNVWRDTKIFRFFVLEIIEDKNSLSEREGAWLQMFNLENLYNKRKENYEGCSTLERTLMEHIYSKKENSECETNS